MNTLSDLDQMWAMAELGTLLFVVDDSKGDIMLWDVPHLVDSDPAGLMHPGEACLLLAKHLDARANSTYHRFFLVLAAGGSIGWQTLDYFHR